MKRPIIFSLLIILFSSCNRTECREQPKIELQGKFSHLIPECNNDTNAEINCIEWLEFVNDTEVDILYGGIDIVQRFRYNQEDSNLSLEGPPTSSFRPIFAIKDPSTLERKDNGDIWAKE
jgi:hypothetical protein